MKVKERITEAPACEVIDLSESEKDVYSGAGWHLAGFKDGKLSQLHELEDYPYVDGEEFDATVDRATRLTNEKLVEMAKEHEVWLVMCSCYQLCEPEEVKPNDAVTIARLARVIGETLHSLYS